MSRRTQQPKILSPQEQTASLLSSLAVMHDAKGFKNQLENYFTTNDIDDNTKKVFNLVSQKISVMVKKGEIGQGHMDSVNQVHNIVYPPDITVDIKVHQEQKIAEANKAKSEAYAQQQAKARIAEEDARRHAEVDAEKAVTFITDLRKQPLKDKIGKAKAYEDAIKLAPNEKDSTMDQLLNVQRQLQRVVRLGFLPRELKREVKTGILSLVQGDSNPIDPKTKKLLENNLGAVLRNEMKKHDIPVNKSWKQRFSDLFKTEGTLNKTKQALASQGLNIEEFVLHVKKDHPPQPPTKAGSTIVPNPLQNVNKKSNKRGSGNSVV